MRSMVVAVLLMGAVAAASEAVVAKGKRSVYGEALAYDAGLALPAALPPQISSVLVEKQVAVGIPQPVPYAVPVDRPVPYAVKVPYPVPVDREVPVRVPVVKHVPVPYEVRVPVIKHVPVVKHVPYPVEKIIREPVYIEKWAPPPVKIIVRKTTGWKLGGGLHSLGGAWD